MVFSFDRASVMPRPVGAACCRCRRFRSSPASNPPLRGRGTPNLQLTASKMRDMYYRAERTYLPGSRRLKLQFVDMRLSAQYIEQICRRLGHHRDMEQLVGRSR